MSFIHRAPEKKAFFVSSNEKYLNVYMFNHWDKFHIYTAPYILFYIICITHLNHIIFQNFVLYYRYSRASIIRTPINLYRNSLLFSKIFLKINFQLSKQPISLKKVFLTKLPVIQTLYFSHVFPLQI